MLCRNPFIKGDLVFGCGQCLACRVGRRRLWMHRLMLEATQHAASCFLTLTYRDPPCGPPRGNLCPKDAQDFLKRLRAHVAPLCVRFYLVGEYGERTVRPHYHLAVFGLGVENEQLFEDVWGKGFVKALPLFKESAAYVVGYVCQKLVDRSPPGRVPQFARMSRRPGLGAKAVDGALVDVLTSEAGWRLLARDGDVPAVLRHGPVGKLPLGRYLRDRARVGVGASKGLPDAKLQEWKDELRSLRRGAKKDQWVEALRSVDEARYLSLEVREKVKFQRRVL